MSELELINDELNKMYSKIIYSNTIGVIFDDGLLLHQYSPKFPIKLNLIKRVEIRKKKWIGYNLLFLSISIILFLIPISYKLTNIQLYWLIASGLISLILSKITSKTSYILLLVMDNLNFTEIKINKYTKNDAKIFSSKANRQIKKKLKQELAI